MDCFHLIYIIQKKEIQMFSPFIFMVAPPIQQYYMYTPSLVMGYPLQKPGEKNGPESESDTRERMEQMKPKKPMRQKTIKRKMTRRKKKGHPKKKPQDPERNVLTNIGNQLMSYFLTKRKSSEVLERVKPEKSIQWQQQFYITLKKIKLKFSGHYNFDKFKEIWYGHPCEGCDDDFRKILRIMSLKYIRTKLICSLLTSKKLSRELRESHLRFRRDLIKILEPQMGNPSRPTTDN